MVNSDLIKYIIKTYELPNNLEKKLFQIAPFRINELGITSFRDYYTYIANLIEKFNVPYNRRYMFSLDSFVGGRSLHEIIGEGHLLLNYGTGIEESTKKLSLLENFKEKDYYNLLFLILTDDNFRKDLIFKNILSSRIERDIEHLKNKFLYRSELRIPKRKIIDIKFSPFFIQFERRNFKRDPLRYFNEYINVYRGMTRTDLFKFDCGLYNSLRTNNQLGLAIPFIKEKPVKFLSIDKVEKIIHAHILYYGNVTKTSKKLGYCKRTISKYWKKYGLLPGRYNGNPLSYFLRHIDRYNGMIRTELKREDLALYTALYKRNQLNLAIPFKLENSRTLSTKEVESIITCHQTCVGNISKAARLTGHCRNVVKRYWKEHKLV